MEAESANDGNEVESSLREWQLAFGNKSTSEWTALLYSAEPRDRILAVIRILSDGDDEVKQQALAMLKDESSPRVKMVVAYKVVGLADNEMFLDYLLESSAHVYVMFAVLQCMKYQRRRVSVDRLLGLLLSDSPFVKLALLDYVASLKLEFPNWPATVSEIRKSLRASHFVEDDQAPSPIFSYRRKFVQKLWRIEKRLAGQSAP
jgi:hypothetical protein